MPLPIFSSWTLYCAKVSSPAFEKPSMNPAANPIVSFFMVFLPLLYDEKPSRLMSSRAA